MKSLLMAITAAFTCAEAMCWGPAAGAAEPAYLIIQPHKTSTAQEEANRQLVLDFYRKFWDQGRMDEWTRWLAPDLRNHDPREPSVGAQAMVDFLKKNDPAIATLRPAARQAAHLFVVAEGDLVFIAHAPPGFDPDNPGSYPGDPGARFIGNLARVKDGRIVEWWFSGARGPSPGRPARAGP